MKKAMTNVDVAALAAELGALLPGARIEKAYQPDRDAVLLRLRRGGMGRLDLLYRLGTFVTLTKRPPENPDQPSMVAKILRNEYGNGRITAVRQLGFDRLLQMDVERGDGVRRLVLEVFGDGNLLLLNTDGTIFLPMRGAEHGARRLKKGEAYQPPPGGAEPFALDAAALQQRGSAASKDIVRFLALDLGFGPLWAEELCLRAGVQKNTAAAAATPADWDALHAAIKDLGDAIGRNDLAPALVYEEGELVDAVPFPMQRYPQPRFQYEEAPTFHAALDTFFCGAGGEDEDGADADDPRRIRYDEARGKLQRQVDQIAGAIEGFETEEAERLADGEMLFLRFQEVQAVLDQLQRARQDRPWAHIAAILDEARTRGDPAAQMVRELRPHDATAVLRLADLEGNERDVTIDVRLNVQENAEVHYDAAKKARSRREGAGTALTEARQRVAALEAKGLDGFGAAPKRAEAVQRHFWFEAYRWTVTPGGLLVVGGRNAAQNDAVVKKYLRDGDRYVHAEVHGAPSIVVRPADGSVATDVPEEELRLAGQFAVCASRAWRQFAQASAYWVTPQQVSKTPRSGEFVPRGAWIVHGKRNVMDHLPMEWAVGRVRFTGDGRPVTRGEEPTTRAISKLLGGPPEAVSTYATEWVRIVPGDMDPNDAAQALAERFGATMEEAQAALPAGPVRIVADSGGWAP
jgi:predicted ribosome quality control (RQC) complex YloA/Tae2 family protein